MQLVEHLQTHIACVQTSPPAVMTNTERAFGMTLLHDNPSYQPRPNTAILSGATASNVTQLQENLSITNSGFSWY